MWDEQRLKRERLDNLREQMKLRGIAALYLCDGPNVQYVLNTKVPSGDVVVPPHGEAIALVRSRDVGYVQRQHANVRPPLYRRSPKRPEDADANASQFAQGVGELMAEYGVRGEALGVDLLRIDALLALTREGIRVVDAVPAIEYARAVKTQDEVAIYRAIGAEYAHTLRAFREALRPGVTENELAAVVVGAWYAAGGESVSQLNVCAGENMNSWSRWPTHRPLQAGEFVGMDLHARSASGLRGDVARTFLVSGAPTSQQRDLYRRAHEYLLANADCFRAGRSYSEVMQVVPKVPETFEEQLYDYNIAHSVGMTPSGYPALDPRAAPIDDVLRPGQVLAIECYFGEKGSPLAVKLEDMILVRDGPPEVLGADIPFDERL